MEIVLPSNHRIVMEFGREGDCLHTCTCCFFRVECIFLFVIYIADCAISDMHEYRCGESCKS